MDELEQENIDKIIQQQTGSGEGSEKSDVTVEDDGITMESLQVTFLSLG